jgi:sugar phosphate isomerase/epimerase
VGLVRCSERGASRTHAKDVVETDGQIRHVAAGTGQLDYSFYLSLLRDLEVPLIARGLSEQQVPWSLAFLRATTQRSNRKRLLGVGVG